VVPKELRRYLDQYSYCFSHLHSDQAVSRKETDFRPFDDISIGAVTHPLIQKRGEVLGMRVLILKLKICWQARRHDRDGASDWPENCKALTVSIHAQSAQLTVNFAP
jgi:hypothetical protein